MDISGGTWDDVPGPQFFMITFDFDGTENKDQYGLQQEKTSEPPVADYYHGRIGLGRPEGVVAVIDDVHHILVVSFSAKSKDDYDERDEIDERGNVRLLH